MSFVEWTVAVALLALALGGGYAGIMLLTRRSIEAPPYKFEGRGVFLLALLYFGGALATLIAFLLLFLAKSS